MWVLFPVGLLGLLISVCSKVSIPKDYPVPKSLDTPVAKALADLRTADRERNEALVVLETMHKDRLIEASQEQVEEMKELKDKPIEEVVAWFSRL